MLAPFAPFISEKIFREIDHLHGNQEMIHKTKYEFNPVSDTTYIETFTLLQRISRLVRSSRMSTKTHTSSKTPIKFCEICMDSLNKIELIRGCIDLIQSELNVIDIAYSSLEGNIKYRYVPNKAVLGKKYKKFANEIYKFFEKGDLEEKDNKIVLFIDAKPYELTCDEYTKEPNFNKDDIFDEDILIKIDFTYDEQIEKMSHLKRFVSDIQQTRKIMGLHPWDKISIEVVRDDFGIVFDNVAFMKKRLECEVNPVSTMKGDRTYEDEDKKIMYSVKRL
jgi:isoleucyl-tRNA synthetase